MYRFLGWILRISITIQMQCKLFERRSVALRYHDSKISRSQQPFMTETAQAKEKSFTN